MWGIVMSKKKSEANEMPSACRCMMRAFLLLIARKQTNKTIKRHRRRVTHRSKRQYA
jgi:hypothetical protein